MRFLIFILFVIATSSLCFGDVIELKSGKRITCTIIKKDDKNVTIDVLGERTTYSYNSIATVYQEDTSLNERSFNVNIKTDLTKEGTYIHVVHGQLSKDQLEFEKQFKKCTPGAEFKPSLASVSTYYYKIIGPIDGGCKILEKFIENVNPDFVGKSMECVYDNTLSLENAILNKNECSGELYDILFGKQQTGILDKYWPDMRNLYAENYLVVDESPIEEQFGKIYPDWRKATIWISLDKDSNERHDGTNIAFNT